MSAPTLTEVALSAPPSGSPGLGGLPGVLGSCTGGGSAPLDAWRGFHASAPNRARLPADLDAALVGACPVVASSGGRDRSLSGAAARLEDALTRGGVPHDVREDPTAGHSFLNDAPNGSGLLRPVFERVLHTGPDPVAAADPWRRTEAFLGEHLGDGAAA